MNVRVKIDYDHCTSCKTCLKTCVFGVFEWLDDMPLVSNPASCSGCLDCSKACPMGLIEIKIS